MSTGFLSLLTWHPAKKTQGICFFFGENWPQKIGDKSSIGVCFFKKMEGEQLMTSDCILKKKITRLKVWWFRGDLLMSWIVLVVSCVAVVDWVVHPPRIPVTTRIITFLVGNPYKPSFVTATGRGDNPCCRQWQACFRNETSYVVSMFLMTVVPWFHA